MTITAIIVNYHTAAFLPQLIQNLEKCQKISAINIVDNSGEAEPGQFPPVVNLIKPGKNIGFAAGVNLAAARSRSDYLLLVNPDMRLLPGCVDHLLAACVEYQAAIAGPRFFWDDAKQFKLPPSQGTSSWMEYALSVSDISPLDRNLLSFYWEIRHDRFWKAATPFPEPFLSGACMLIDRIWACSNDQSVLDERFFLYYEDNDICVRAKNEGRPVLAVPDAQAVHYYNQSPEPEEGKAALMKTAHQKYRDKYYGDVKWNLALRCREPADNGCWIKNNIFVWPLLQPKGRLFFEFGVHPNFVPFAQTEIYSDNTGKWPENYKMPPEIWDKIAHGTYFCRLRDEINGTLKIWKWQK